MDRVTRRRALALGGTALTALVAGCSGDGGGSDGGGGDGTTVDMTAQLLFDPESITVSPGTTITWENVGGGGHSVTAYEQKIPSEADYFASGGFDSESKARSNIQQGLIADGETYEHTFDVSGVYEYFCVPHETAGMVGKITVE